jgi:hypothetical protein
MKSKESSGGLCPVTSATTKREVARPAAPTQLRSPDHQSQPKVERNHEEAHHNKQQLTREAASSLRKSFFFAKKESKKKNKNRSSIRYHQGMNNRLID